MLLPIIFGRSTIISRRRSVRLFNYFNLLEVLEKLKKTLTNHFRTRGNNSTTMLGNFSCGLDSALEFIVLWIDSRNTHELQSIPFWMRYSQYHRINNILAFSSPQLPQHMALKSYPKTNALHAIEKCISHRFWKKIYSDLKREKEIDGFSPLPWYI